jgi:hypothetical protein
MCRVHQHRGIRRRDGARHSKLSGDHWRKLMWNEIIPPAAALLALAGWNEFPQYPPTNWSALHKYYCFYYCYHQSYPTISAGSIGESDTTSAIDKVCLACARPLIADGSLFTHREPGLDWNIRTKSWDIHSSAMALGYFLRAKGRPTAINQQKKTVSRPCSIWVYKAVLCLTRITTRSDIQHPSILVSTTTIDRITTFKGQTLTDSTTLSRPRQVCLYIGNIVTCGSSALTICAGSRLSLSLEHASCQQNVIKDSVGKAPKWKPKGPCTKGSPLWVTESMAYLIEYADKLHGLWQTPKMRGIMPAAKETLVSRAKTDSFVSIIRSSSPVGGHDMVPVLMEASVYSAREQAPGSSSG